MGHLESFKQKISDCIKIEENLWHLLKENKHSQLKEEHSKLKILISELSNEVTLIHNEEKKLSHDGGTVSKDMKVKLTLLEKLLLDQELQLIDIEKLPKDEIVRVLNGDKKGQNVSETSQKMKDIETGIEHYLIGLVDKYFIGNMFQSDKVRN